MGQSCTSGSVVLRVLHVPDRESLVVACVGTWHSGGVTSGGHHQTQRPGAQMLPRGLLSSLWGWPYRGAMTP